MTHKTMSGYEFGKMVEAAGISHAEIARRSGIHPDTLLKWRKGKHDVSTSFYNRAMDAYEEARAERLRALAS